jgi:hypothetical protein
MRPVRRAENPRRSPQMSADVVTDFPRGLPDGDIRKPVGAALNALAALCVCLFRTKHFCSSQGSQKVPPYSSYAPKRGPKVQHVARAPR